MPKITFKGKQRHFPYTKKGYGDYKKLKKRLTSDGWMKEK